MQVVPNIAVKMFKDCAEGELVIVPIAEGRTNIGIVAMQESTKAVILLERMKATSVLIEDSERTTVGSMGVDYRIEVDVDCASFADRDFVKACPGWLNATAGGWEMATHKEDGDWYRFKLEIPMTGSSPKLSNNNRIIFPRWSIIIEKKVVFRFDATAK